MIKNIYVDFDGVINSYQTPVNKTEGVNELPDDALPGALEWLSDLIKNFHVTIYSTRLVNGAETERAISQWLLDQGLYHYDLDKLSFSAVKHGAHVYIDDRAWRYEGGAYPTVQELEDFKPWGKK